MNRHKFKENFDHFKINTLHQVILSMRLLPADSQPPVYLGCRKPRAAGF